LSNVYGGDLRRHTGAKPSRWRLMLALAVAASVCAVAVGSTGAAAAPAMSGVAATPTAAHTSKDTINQIVARMQKELPGVPASLIKQACQEKSLSVLGLAFANIQQIVALFHFDMPCLSVDLTSLGGPQLLARFQSDLAAGHPADIVQSSFPNVMNDLATQGAFLKYQPVLAKRPGYRLAIRNPGNWYEFCVAPIGISYNTNVVSPSAISGITQWSQLTSLSQGSLANVPIAMVKPVGTGNSSDLVVHAVTGGLGQTGLQQLFKGRTVLEATDSTSPANAVVSGQVGIFIGVESQVVPQIQSGAPVRIQFPSPLAVAPFLQEIPRLAAHPAAAKIFQEWVLSPRGQQLYNTLGGVVPADTSIADHRSIKATGWYHLPTKIQVPTFYGAFVSKLQSEAAFFNTLKSG